MHLVLSNCSISCWVSSVQKVFVAILWRVLQCWCQRTIALQSSEVAGDISIAPRKSACSVVGSSATVAADTEKLSMSILYPAFCWLNQVNYSAVCWISLCPYLSSPSWFIQLPEDRIYSGFPLDAIRHVCWIYSAGPSSVKSAKCWWICWFKSAVWDSLGEFGTVRDNWGLTDIYRFVQ